MTCIVMGGLIFVCGGLYLKSKSGISEPRSLETEKVVDNIRLHNVIIMSQ